MYNKEFRKCYRDFVSVYIHYVDITSKNMLTKGFGVKGTNNAEMDYIF